MRIVIQRVNSAAVFINNNKYSFIQDGLLCLVGFCNDDNESDFTWSINKIINLKIFKKSEIWRIKNEQKKYNSYCIKYYTKSLDSYKLYKEKYAKKIQKKHSIKYKSHFNVKREILELVHEC